MGEYADMFIDGLVDSETGELIDGDAPGYPRSPSRDKRRQQKAAVRNAKPFQCHECGKRLATLQALTDHRADKHGIPRPPVVKTVKEGE